MSMSSDTLPPVSNPALIAQRIRADVRAMQAYVVQDAEGMIKLDAMENPYPLPQNLQMQLGRRLAKLPLNRYPSGEPQQLMAALREFAQVPADAGLLLGNGSDEIINLIHMACAQPGAKVLAPQPSFVIYELSAKLAGLEFIGVDLDKDFELDEAAMIAAIQTHRPAVIWLAYPNNPTANSWQAGSMQRIIAAAAQTQSIVVVDEAYGPFAAHSWWTQWLQSPAEHGHVLLMRTLSKFGLAGIRLGYLMGEAALVGEIDKVRPPYNINILTAETAAFALENADEFARQASEIINERERLLTELAKLPGCQVFPSQANMVVLRLPDAPAAFAGLKERGILVKNVAASHPLLAQCLRLTVGTPEENTQLLSALRTVVL